MESREGWQIYGQLLVISVAWGGAFLLTKVAVETIPPSLLSAGRGLLAAATLGVVLALSRDGLRGKAADGWVPAVVLGTLSGWLPNVLTAWALTRIDSSLAAILGAASPIIVGVLAHYVLVHEPMGRSQFGGVFLGFVGMALMIGVDAISVAGQDIAGQRVMVAVAVSYALGTVYGRLKRPVEPARLALRMQLVSGSAALLIALALKEPWTVRPSVVSALSVVALAVVSGALPFWLMLRVLSRARAVVVGTTGYLIPVSAVILGVLVLGERLGLAPLGGMALVLAGILATGREAPPQAAVGGD